MIWGGAENGFGVRKLRRRQRRVCDFGFAQAARAGGGDGLEAAARVVFGV